MRDRTRFSIDKQLRRLAHVPPLVPYFVKPVAVSSGVLKQRVPYVTESMVEYVLYQEDMDPETIDPIASDVAGEDVARQHEMRVARRMVVAYAPSGAPSVAFAYLGAGCASLIAWSLMRGGSLVRLRVGDSRDKNDRWLSEVSTPPHSVVESLVAQALRRSRSIESTASITIDDAVLVLSSHWTELTFHKFCREHSDCIRSLHAVWLLDRRDRNSPAGEAIGNGQHRFVSTRGSQNEAMRHLDRLTRIAGGYWPTTASTIEWDEVEPALDWIAINVREILPISFDGGDP